VKPEGSPEFDRHARDYSAGFDDPLKQAIGADARAFLRPKLDLLRRAAARGAGPDGAPLRYLDFGCGTGDFLALVREAGLPWEAEGCDVSPGMLAEARRRWPDLDRSGALWVAGDEFPEERYDVITAICVLHHVPPAGWPATLVRLRRALRPGGLLCVFEHNPWNPVTRWMIRRTAIDANAVLLSPRTCARLLRGAGFPAVAVSHFLFVPPRWARLARAERALRWLPLGGQYVAAARADQFRVAAPAAAP